MDYLLREAALYLISRLWKGLKIRFSNMTEEKSMERRNKPQYHNQRPTRVHRNLVDANWSKLQESNLNVDEKKTRIEDPNRYTGTFRRDRKKALENGDIKPMKNVSPVRKSHFGGVNNTKDGKLTKFIAIDCEMVGVGNNGLDNMLARVSLVNKFGDCIYDKFVKPREEVKNYRTNVSGIRREDLLNGEDFYKVQREVFEILKGKILVGHAVQHDLDVLFLSHPKYNIRDTSKYKPLRMIVNGGTPSLKRLAKELLNLDIQSGEHSSVEDAKAVMKIYNMLSKKWEEHLKEVRQRYHKKAHLNMS